MTVRTALWKVGKNPQELLEAQLPSEKSLEDMVVAAPRLLSDEWMLIGRQVSTGFGGIIDLVAIAPDGSLILIELKRDRTPRDVVAQAIDYAAWVERLGSDEIGAIYGRFRPGEDLAAVFQKKFGTPLDEESLNQSHQIVIVAAELDPSSERIVAYLAERDIAINVLCFQVFSNGSEQFLSRTWLLDPMLTQSSVKAVGANEPWNGEFYHSFGHGVERSWDDATKYGFISAGGGLWYTNTFALLSPGDRVWVNVPRSGYVGVCKVLGGAIPARDFLVQTEQGQQPFLEIGIGSYHKEFRDDLDKCEYFVPVEWLQTVPLSAAVKQVGFFGNQNTICRPTSPKWRSTVEKLKQSFRGWDSKA
ncbi:endonuclease NucS domain-containing protein [Massilia sp. TS11]|uniref:endonuclease NucS domain-containing protein n=1 Tax=Massilia sp. TS11 TaxID=2908003 RepID=UPI001EDA0D33|nr:endonuclease NucS domain-containing protein [Massilia sp. TS11]MCG2583515.1 endonuclease NucS [Massilia sp. TS11]